MSDKKQVLDESLVVDKEAIAALNAMPVAGNTGTPPLRERKKTFSLDEVWGQYGPAISYGIGTLLGVGIVYCVHKWYSGDVCAVSATNEVPNLGAADAVHLFD